MAIGGRKKLIPKSTTEAYRGGDVMWGSPLMAMLEEALKMKGIEYLNDSEDWTQGGDMRWHIERLKYNLDRHNYSCIWGYCETNQERFGERKRFNISIGYPFMLEVMVDDYEPFGVEVDELIDILKDEDVADKMVGMYSDMRLGDEEDGNEERPVSD